MKLQLPPKPTKTKMKRLLRISSGYILITLGVIGLVLPLIPGMVLIGFGIYLLATYEKEKNDKGTKM